jgi:CHASE3 domain sensor protein
MLMAEIDAKAYLQQVERYENLITAKLEEMDRLRALTTKITSSWKDDVVSSSGSKDKLGDAIAKIIDLRSEINNTIDEYVDRKREVSSVIEKVEDSDQLAVLTKKYLLYESLEQISVEMHMSYRNVCYIHGEALLAVADLLKGET